MIDQHFTPDPLAEELVATIPQNITGIVVDPAAGEGALLSALRRVVRSDLTFIAIDQDPLAVRALLAGQPDWTVSRADTLNPRSRSASTSWKIARKQGVELVLLNPPFSYRGGPSIETSFGDFRGRLSPAAQFVAISLSELRPRIGMWAILPDGVIHGEKYRGFWEEVRKSYSIQVVRELSSSSFSGVRARCSLVAIRPCVLPSGVKEPMRGVTSNVVRAIGCRCVDVVRGRVPRHREFDPVEATAPYLHTTNVQAGAIVGTLATAPRALATGGPFVVLPRIGSPKGKIAVASTGVVLSDCLIALRPLSASNLSSLCQQLHVDAVGIADLYRGTGALYVTIGSVVDYLQGRGWHVRVAKASQEPSECNCGAQRTSSNGGTLRNSRKRGFELGGAEPIGSLSAQA